VQGASGVFSPFLAVQFIEADSLRVRQVVPRGRHNDNAPLHTRVLGRLLHHGQQQLRQQEVGCGWEYAHVNKLLDVKRFVGFASLVEYVIQSDTTSIDVFDMT
jgi:hypothetical protein